MAQLSGKQIKDSSISLDKLLSSGLVSFSSGATMSFGVGSTLTTEDSNIISGIDVVNKNYVDAIASGIDPKIPVRLVSFTSSITLSGGIGTLIIDGITVSAFDRILVAGQAGPNIATNSNGIYIATSSAWYRSGDSDGAPDNEVSHGNFVFVTDGNTYEHSGWVLSITDASNPDQILVGTESQGWVQFSEQTNIVAGDGLFYTGQILNVGVGTGLTISSNQISISDTTVSAGSYGQANSVLNITVNAQGQLTSASTQSILIDSNQISDFSLASENVIFTDSNFVDGITLTFSVTAGNSVTAEVALNSLTSSRFDSINTPNPGYVLGFTSSGQFYWLDPTSVGDISDVIAGSGLTGGGSSGLISLDVNVDNGLSIVSDYIGIGGTLSRTTLLNGDGNDLFFNNFENIVFTASVFDVISDGFISLDAGTGSVQILADDQVSIISNNNDVTIASNNNIFIYASGSQITTSNNLGVIYSSDYSGTFVTNSLISKKYVDDALQSFGSGTIIGVTAGNGLSGGGTSGAVTLDVNLGVNSGLTFSGDDIVLQVDGLTIQLVNGVLQGAAQGVLGVTAGQGLSGGGTSSYFTIDVNLGDNSGLTFSGDNIIIDSNIAGDGLSISSGVLSVNTSNGISVIGDSLQISSTLAGSGLTFSSGVLDVNVNSDSLEITNDSIRLRDTITGDRNFQDSLIVGGNLTVNGTVSYINTQTVLIEDNILTLNATFSGSPFLNSGIEVIRGASQTAALIWDESLDLWSAGLSGSTSTIITEAGLGLTKSGNILSINLQPAYNQRNLTPSATIDGADGQNTGISISNTPSQFSMVNVYVNGSLQYLGDGVTSSGVDCYFSSDGGTTAKNIINISSSDVLYWNGNFDNSIGSGFSLSTTDRIDIIYQY